MPANPLDIVDSLFTNLIVGLEGEFNIFSDRITTEIARLRSLGIPDEQILISLNDQLANRTGIFSDLIGKLSGQIDATYPQVSNNVSNAKVAQFSDLLIWQIDPTTQESCDTCIERSSMPAMSFDNWQAIGLPGYAFKSGNIGTECGLYCKCSLVAAP